MTPEIFLGLPFLKKKEFIFILHTLAKVAALASLLRLDGADQRINRLRQLYALPGKDLHSYDDQDHENWKCKWLANKSRKIRRSDSPFNNEGLDEYERTVGMYESIICPQYLVEPQHIEGG